MIQSFVKRFRAL